LTVQEPGVLRDVFEKAADESVHAPLLIRPAGLNHGVRRQSLTQPVDIFPTLCEWFGLERPEGLHGRSLLPDIRGEDADPRRLAFAASQKSITTVRTHEHYLVQRYETGGEGSRRLFAKPEDAWEVNDLAAQRPQVVEELAGECERFFGERETTIGRS